jgi:hypothetical protein
MITIKTLKKFATLIDAINTHEKNDKKTYRKELSPEVTTQVTAIEQCLYGLLDRIAYAHLDRTGKPIHLNAKTAKAFLDTVKSVRENEGEYGNSDEHWFNILTRYPEGTLDGVLKVEHDVAERMEEGHPAPEVVDRDHLEALISQREQESADNDNLAVEAARTLAANWDALT